jgi:hypothetical protein
MAGKILLAALVMLYVGGQGSRVTAQGSASVNPPPASDAVQASTEEVLDTISLDRAIYFLTADGTDAIAPSGLYRVKIGAPGRLRLNPAKDSDALLVQALTIHHQEKIAEPVALSIPDRDDMHHVVLLLPDGQGFDAVASYSEVRPRGWNLTPAMLELIGKAFAEKEKPIRKEEKHGGHQPVDLILDLAVIHGARQMWCRHLFSTALRESLQEQSPKETRSRRD